MRTKILIVILLFSNILCAQTNDEIRAFIPLFKSEISKFPIGKIEEHYDQGYFRTFAESDYFDKNVEIGITTIYQRCIEKNESASKQEIAHFFEQHKKLKAQRQTILSKMDDFIFMKSYLKIRFYGDDLKNVYERGGIVRTPYKGLIEVIVLDLPSGIGSLEKKYLDIWKKTETEINAIAKENTLKDLNQKFEKAQTAQSGEEFYLLANDSNLFVTSSLLDLKKSQPPIGKYGTFISIPNNTTIVALPLNDKQKIDAFCLNFMGLTNYMFESKETNPMSNNLFWINGSSMLLIEKDIPNKKLIYPEELKKLIEK